MTMLLSDAWERSNFATGKASEISRQLSLAGIAVIWLFKTSDVAKPIAENMLLPLWFLLSALVLDLFQYLYTGIIWAAFSRRREKQHGSSAGTTEIADSPDWINYPAWFIFGAKICVLAYGYWQLLVSLKGIIGMK